MIKRGMVLNGDSGNSTSRRTSDKHHRTLTNKDFYKNVKIQRSIGKPSVSRQEITKAVRAVMREDGLIK